MADKGTLAVCCVTSPLSPASRVSFLITSSTVSRHTSPLSSTTRRYNVTRERVRQVEAKAMHKLQELVGKGNMGVADYSLSGPGSEKGSLVARSSRGTHKQ